ncbi:putative glutathione S-transferase [Annulohypoxylon bovei var. microspora]|nr:putative glutathione S-transferase [Annulohypoxylon bovei var. microspora]
MSNQEIILFDLPSKPPNKAWSPNPWKTRFVLNYKGLPYKTEWVEYPDIKPKFQDHLPKADAYTIPTVVLPDGTWVTESLEIAKVLEKKHPEPSLHLDSPYIAKIFEQLTNMRNPIGPVFIPGVLFNLLNEASQDYFRTTREEAVGKTMEEYAKEGGASAWETAAPCVQKVTALLKENSEGPFFEGKTIGFADFIWGGWLLFMQRISDEAWAGALKASGEPEVHLKLLEALKPWSERDDH